MPRTLTNQAALGTSYADELDAIYDVAEAMPVLQETAGLAFPAVLDDMPEERRLAYITEILLAEARIAAGVDD